MPLGQRRYGQHRWLLAVLKFTGEMPALRYSG